MNKINYRKFLRRLFVWPVVALRALSGILLLFLSFLTAVFAPYTSTLYSTDTLVKTYILAAAMLAAALAHTHDGQNYFDGIVSIKFHSRFRKIFHVEYRWVVGALLLLAGIYSGLTAGLVREFFAPTIIAALILAHDLKSVIMRIGPPSAGGIKRIVSRIRQSATSGSLHELAQWLAPENVYQHY